MPRTQGLGPLYLSPWNVHEVGSLMERAMRLGPGLTHVPLWGPSGDVWWGCGVGSGVPVGSSGGQVAQARSSAASEAKRLELSASAAKGLELVLVTPSPHHEGERSYRVLLGEGCSPTLQTPSLEKTLSL